MDFPTKQKALYRYWRVYIQGTSKLLQQADSREDAVAKLQTRLPQLQVTGDSLVKVIFGTIQHDELGQAFVRILQTKEFDNPVSEETVELMFDLVDVLGDYLVDYVIGSGNSSELWLISGLACSLVNQDAERGKRIYTQLVNWYMNRGHTKIALQWMSSSKKRESSATSMIAALDYMINHRYETAINLLNQSLQQNESEPGNNPQQMIILCLSLFRAGRHEEANELADQIIAQDRNSPNYPTTSVMNAHQVKAQIYSLDGSLEKARHHNQTAIEIAQTTGRPLYDTANMLMAAGQIDLHNGLFNDALTYFERALSYLEQTGDMAALLKVAHGMGAAFLRQQKYDTAIQYLLQAAAMAEDVGDTYYLAWACILLIEAFHKLDDPAKAIEYEKRAQQQIGHIESNYPRAELFIMLARTTSATGNRSTEQYYRRAMNSLQAINNLEGYATVAEELGTFLVNLGRHTAAIDTFYEGLTVADPDTSVAIRLKSSMVAAFTQAGELDLAKSQIDQLMTSALLEGEPVLAIVNETVMANIAVKRNDFEAAVLHHQRAIQLYEEYNKDQDLFREVAARSMIELGFLFSHLGEIDRSQYYFLAGKQLAEQQGNIGLELVGQGGYAETLAKQKEYQQAREQIAPAVTQIHKVPIVVEKVRILSTAIDVHLILKQFDVALQVMQILFELAYESGVLNCIQQVNTRYAKHKATLEKHFKRYAEARRTIKTALEVVTKPDKKTELAALLETIPDFASSKRGAKKYRSGSMRSPRSLRTRTACPPLKK